MPLSGLERWFVAALCAEVLALAFLAVALAQRALAMRFATRTPYPELSLRTPGARFHREVVRTRGQGSALLLCLVVWLLATPWSWWLLPDALPFESPWWATWVLEAHLLGVLAYLGIAGLRLHVRYRQQRAAWHANLAVANLLQRFALTGHRVFHELTVESLCIDHVVVGPRGVFLVNVVVREKRLKRGQADTPVRLLPVERQLEIGGVRGFEPVFAATRRLTETGRLLERLVGRKHRPVSALVAPGWDCEPTVAGEHLLFDLSNLGALLSWAEPAHGLLEEDLVAVHDHLLEHCAELRPV